MKNIIKHTQLLMGLLLLAVMMSGCELAGLDLQTPYKYDYSAGMHSNETHMTAWEFIQSRPDLFSILQEGIEYAGIQDMYKQSDRTYLLLTNTAFLSTSSTDFAYFTMHQFPDPNDTSVMIIPETLTLYPVDQVKELLLYHIVKGQWTWSNIPAMPTWFDTEATADTAKVNMYLLKDRNPNVEFNNFDGHYKSLITARTTNLRTSDGSYMHVLDSWLDRPTRAQLR